MHKLEALGLRELAALTNRWRIVLRRPCSYIAPPPCPPTRAAPVAVMVLPLMRLGLELVSWLLLPLVWTIMDRRHFVCHLYLSLVMVQQLRQAVCRWRCGSPHPRQGLALSRVVKRLL